MGRRMERRRRSNQCQLTHHIPLHSKPMDRFYCIRLMTVKAYFITYGCFFPLCHLGPSTKYVKVFVL